MFLGLEYSPSAKATAFIHHSYDGGVAGKRSTDVASAFLKPEDGDAESLTFLGNDPLHEDDHGERN